MDKKLEELENKIETLYAERDQQIRIIRINWGAPLFGNKADLEVESVEKEYRMEIEPLERQRKYILEKNQVPKSGLVIEAGRDIINKGEIHAREGQLVNLSAAGNVEHSGKIKFLGKTVENFSTKHPWLFNIIIGVFLILIGYLFKLIWGLFWG